jgi:hypothetical protein
MHSLILSLRVVHVGLGAFWAGAVLFINLFLAPSLQASAPESTRVLVELRRRRYFGTLLVVGACTLLSGFALLWLDSAGLSPDWLRSGFGLSLLLGAGAALTAFLLAIVVVRPAVVEMGALQRELASPDGPARAAALNRVQAIGRRLTAAGRWTVVLLVIALLGMAVGRYV